MSSPVPAPSPWFAVDWGTTNLRAWQMDDAGKIHRTYASDDGAGGLFPDQFEETLIGLIGADLSPHTTTDVFCCGMVGSAQGWCPADYRMTPTPHAPSPTEIRRFDAGQGRLRIHILPGVAQADPADVMRGEETQIAGYFLGANVNETAICCPGTHSKWALADAKGIQGFKTFPTGELFALLSKVSILRHSMGTDPLTEDQFVDAATRAISAPDQVLSELFPIRARDLLAPDVNTSGKSCLSGLLIGLELANARSFWLNRPVVLIGTGELASLYRIALHALGAFCGVVDGGDMVRAGLIRARQSMLATAT